MPRLPFSADKRELIVRLGQNVRRERNARELSQEALAELVEVHPRVVQKLELGLTNVLATTLIRIQAALDCPWERLMPPPPSRSGVKTPARRMRH